MTVVEIRAVEGTKICVTGLDALDRSPLLDIKPMKSISIHHRASSGRRILHTCPENRSEIEPQMLLQCLGPFLKFPVSFQLTPLGRLYLIIAKFILDSPWA
jgi:hypothetical protein